MYFDFVIAVEDGAAMEDQHAIVQDCVKEAFGDQSVYEIEFGIRPYKPGTVGGWSDACIPYGDDGNTTIGQYLAGKTL